MNLAPVNNVPGDQSDSVNTPLVFSTANGNAIQITDPNIDPNDSSVDVANSSFESPSAQWYAPSEGDWNFGGYTDDGRFNDSGILQNGAWDNPTLPDGQQVGFIQGNGMISQDINFAEAGNYTISFQAAHRDYSTGSSQTNPIMVQVDGITVGIISRIPWSSKATAPIRSRSPPARTRICFIGMAADTEDRTTFIDRGFDRQDRVPGQRDSFGRSRHAEPPSASTSIRRKSPTTAWCSRREPDRTTRP